MSPPRQLSPICYHYCFAISTVVLLRDIIVILLLLSSLYCCDYHRCDILSLYCEYHQYIVAIFTVVLLRDIIVLSLWGAEQMGQHPIALARTGGPIRRAKAAAPTAEPRHQGGRFRGVSADGGIESPPAVAQRKRPSSSRCRPRHVFGGYGGYKREGERYKREDTRERERGREGEREGAAVFVARRHAQAPTLHLMTYECAAVCI